MRKFLLVPSAAIVALASGVPALAQNSSGPDFTPLTTGIDTSSLVTALLAVGGIMVAVAVVMLGIRKILRMIR